VTSINVTSQSLWSIVIPNGAHHVDLMFTTKDDPPDLAIAREFEVEKMKEWLGISTVVGSSVVATENSSSSSSADTKEEKVEQASSSTPSPVYSHVEIVHVVNSCHLDIGFIKSSADIINLYFDHHLPKAATVGRSLRATPGAFSDDKLSFMFQSWVISMFFDCPTGLGLHCPNATAVSSVRDAVEIGDIVWHAFPHNAQLEVMGETMIHAGLQMTRDVDALFTNQRVKTTLSQRDVPGMPRSIVPLLNRSGISAISIGKIF
jgi:hypothetical protein